MGSDKCMYPKELICELYAPGSNLVEFVATLRNIPGALSQASNVIATLGINVLSGFHTALPTETQATWSFFAELNKKTKTEQVIDALKGTGIITDVKVRQAQSPGLLIDDLHFPLCVLGDRAVVFRLDTLEAMFRHLTEMAGGNIARVLRHQLGIEAGRAKARRVQEEFHLHGEDALRIILAERVAKGWGIASLLKYDSTNGAALITVKELYECICVRSENVAIESKGEFFRGYLEGVLSTLMNSKINVREIECVREGHLQCSFEAYRSRLAPEYLLSS